MIALITVLVAFQGFYLMLAVIDGDRTAATPDRFPSDYGLVTLAIYGMGFGLVALGHRLGSRRRSATAGRRQEVSA